MSKDIQPLADVTLSETCRLGAAMQKRWMMKQPPGPPRYTIEQVEGYMREHLAGFVNGEDVFVPAAIEHNEALWDAIENLRDKKDGLAAHARKKEDEG